MTTLAKTLIAFLFFAVTAYSAHAENTPSITADLAKKCREQAVKAHPTPVAGTKANGIEKAQREFFQACISKGAENK